MSNGEMNYMGRLVPYNPSVLLEELCQYLKTGRYNGPRVPETATTLSSDDLLISLTNAREKRAIMVAWQAGIAQGREIQKIESEAL